MRRYAAGHQLVPGRPPGFYNETALAPLSPLDAAVDAMQASARKYFVSNLHNELAHRI